MSKKIIKILTAIGGFTAGFLLFSLLSFNSIPPVVRITLYSILVLILIVVGIGIALYMHRYNRVRLYYDLLTDYANKNIKPHLEDLGINRAKLIVEKKNESIYIKIMHNGFYTLLLAKEEGISMGFIIDEGFNELSDSEKNKIESFMDKKRSGKELLSLTNDELYQELVAFDSLTM